MSRRRLVIPLVLAGALAVAPPVLAQDGATGSPPDRIDLTITTPPPSDTSEQCRREAEVAVVSGEIIVCGARPGENHRVTTREDAQRRYAEATMGRGTPDVAGAGIFRGAPTFSGICVPGIFNCPKPAAVFVDVRALPQAPPGSDADRIARGLQPLGESESTIAARQISAAQRAELGLPEPELEGEPLVEPSGTVGEAVSPEGSVAPVAPR